MVVGVVLVTDMAGRPGDILLHEERDNDIYIVKLQIMRILLTQFNNI